MITSNQGGSTRRDWLVEWVNRNVTISHSTHCNIQEDVNPPHTPHFRQRSTDMLLHQSAPAVFQNYAPPCTRTCHLRYDVI